MNGPTNHYRPLWKTPQEQIDDLLSVRSIDELPQHPGENGPRLATFRRSDTEEMRLNLSSYEGHYYLQYFTCRKGDDGRWNYVKTQSIRLSELDLFAVAIETVKNLFQNAPQDRGDDE